MQKMVVKFYKVEGIHMAIEVKSISVLIQRRTMVMF